MKKFTKIALIVASFVLVAALSVGGTLAWLQDDTEIVQNTFSPTNIDIELWEHEYTPSHGAGADGIVGSLGTDEVDEVDDYPLIPTAKLPKDPFVRVKSGSERCWIFVEVVESDNLDTFISYELDSNWTKMTDVYGDNEGQMYYYNTVVDATVADQILNVLKNKTVTVNNVTSEQIDGLTTTSGEGDAVTTTVNNPELSFYAYAVQELGFDTAAAAWGETYGKVVG